MATKFIGRIQELKSLNECLKKARSNSGNVVLINGNSGIGKTALVHEFLKSPSNEESIIAHTECNDKENINAYAPIKNLIIQLSVNSLKQDKKLNKEERRKKLKSFFSESGTKWISLIPLIGGFVSVGIETIQSYKKVFKDQPVSKIEGLEQVYEIFENELRRVAKDKPLVVFIDDIQWGDSATLNFIFHLSKIIRKNPFKILLLISYRPDEIKIGRKKSNEFGEIVNIRHPFADKLNELRNYTKKENHLESSASWLSEISMTYLSLEETNIFLNNSFPQNNFSKAFIEQIHALTNGNPLFLNGITDTFIQNKIIEQKNGVYVLSNVDIINLPVSVNAVIQEKIDRLDEKLRKILTFASISGKKFIIQEIEKILKIDEFELFDFLEVLNQKHGLLNEEEGLFFDDLILDIYSFSEKLIFHYIYDNIDNAKRRRLHKHIALTIKSIWKEKLNTNAEINKKYNTHLQIAQGLIDGKTRLITVDINNVNKEEKYKNLINAADDEIKQAEENAKIWADDETNAHAEKALAFLSKIEQKNGKTEKLRFEAYYYKWQAFYSGKIIGISNYGKELDRIAIKLAEIADFFNNNDKQEAGEYLSRVAMAYTLMYNYEKANEYFYKEFNREQKYSGEMSGNIDDWDIELLIREKKYDEVSKIYLDWQKETGCEIYDEDLLLNIGIALSKNVDNLHLKKAEKFLTNAYMVAEEYNERYEFTMAAYYNGVVKYKLGKYKEAKYYLEIAKIRYERWKNPNSSHLNWEWDDIYTILKEIEKITKK